MTHPASRAESHLPIPPVSRGSRVQSGKIGWALLWFLGIPLPILLIVYAIMA